MLKAHVTHNTKPVHPVMASVSGPSGFAATGDDVPVCDKAGQGIRKSPIRREAVCSGTIRCDSYSLQPLDASISPQIVAMNAATVMVCALVAWLASRRKTDFIPNR
ncbi:hypothetical protein OZX57_04475 [Bifidobacterium sp. ESL0682]|uniref:hypothetical protein n=1 Tax=Bifidobacterium sp. ESL0682 TaxID=2983212 RepID=UPI0023F823DD|nr:hypothetical protein [Bifidobacterium sp. ESL0682]WEV41336.1 hypothetical protein OZX57_04475 [Bifidobacterium sp. ESL0682]